MAKHDDAALILQVAASNFDYFGGNTYDAEHHLGMRGALSYTPTGELARKALSRVRVEFAGAHAYAEAEALLRNGEVR